MSTFKTVLSTNEITLLRQSLSDLTAGLYYFIYNDQSMTQYALNIEPNVRRIEEITRAAAKTYERLK